MYFCKNYFELQIGTRKGICSYVYVLFSLPIGVFEVFSFAFESSFIYAFLQLLVMNKKFSLLILLMALIVILLLFGCLQSVGSKEPTIFTDNVTYEKPILQQGGFPPNPKIKVTIINPLSESIFFEGCNQYSYSVIDSRVAVPKIPDTRPFRVCAWEGNAFEIKAGESKQFEENLLSVNDGAYESYALRTTYFTRCEENRLPSPLSKLNCKNSKTIDSPNFRVTTDFGVLGIPNDFNVLLKREGCYGTCPIYSVEVHANGKVKYNGEKFVQTPVERSYNISTGNVKQLVDKINSMNFFSLKNEYTQGATFDAGSAKVTITMNGQTKTIWHAFEDTSSPASLKELEDLIDQVTNSFQWTEYQK